MQVLRNTHNQKLFKENIVDLNQFIEWQAAEKGRSVSIEITRKTWPDDDKNEIRVWVYNYVLQVGQHVNDVSEIDLPATFEAAEREKYEALKKKFEPEAK